MIHLIASDIDGTLLQGGQTRLDPALFDVIERLEQHGIRFAAASGRQYTNLRRLFAPCRGQKSTISAKNGSLVISDGSVLYKQVIDRALGTKILRCMLEMEGLRTAAERSHAVLCSAKGPGLRGPYAIFCGNDVAVVEGSDSGAGTVSENCGVFPGRRHRRIPSAYRAGCGRDDAACGFRYGVGGPAAAGLR